MDGWSGVVEIVKAVAWPVAAGAIAFALKPDLGTFMASLAQRKVAAKALGAEVTLDALPEARQQIATENVEKKAAELPPAPAVTAQPVANSDARLAESSSAAGTVAVVPQLERLPLASRASVNDLESALIEKLQESEPQARMPMLLRALAETRVNLAFETTYRIIFGSQIAFVQTLHTTDRLPKVAAYDVFHNRAAEFPDLAKYGFDKWLGFLQESGLVTVEGEMIGITNLGRDFVVYIAVNALPTNKLW